MEYKKTVTADDKQINKLKEETYAPLGRKEGIKPDELRARIIDTWLYLDIRNEQNLNKAKEKFEEIHQDTAKLIAADHHELTKCHRIKSYARCAQAVTEAALLRRETRLDHIRDDYPLTDNKNWLKWVIIRCVEGNIQAHLEDIPIEHWKYKPEPAVVNVLKLKEGD